MHLWAPRSAGRPLRRSLLPPPPRHTPATHARVPWPPPPPTPADTPLFFSDGSEPDKALDEAVEELHNDILDECTGLKGTYERVGGDASLGEPGGAGWVGRVRDWAAWAGCRQLRGLAARRARTPPLARASLRCHPARHAHTGTPRPAATRRHPRHPPAGASMEALWEASKGQLLEARTPRGAAHARRLFDWHMANLEFANSSPVASLSLRHWDQDDPNELLGAHCFLPGGVPVCVVVVVALVVVAVVDGGGGGRAGAGGLLEGKAGGWGAGSGPPDLPARAALSPRLPACSPCLAQGATGGGCGSCAVSCPSSTAAP